MSWRFWREQPATALLDILRIQLHPAHTFVSNPAETEGVSDE